jgi:hypothetical protein
MKNLESPTAGERRENTQVVDSVKESNSGLSEGGFTRMVHKFNNNATNKSPTTTSRDFRPQEQKVIINKGIAGKIGY